MFDIKSFYEAKDVKDAVEALVREPEAEVISGGTDVLDVYKRQVYWRLSTLLAIKNAGANQ